MSFGIDANVLLYASNADSVWSAPARAFLERVCGGPELIVLPWPVLMAYLRIATHPGIFPRPLTAAQAEANVEALLELPHVRAVGEGADFWRRYRTLSGLAVARGNAVPDAHVVAILLQHGVTTLYTRDVDFRRYPGLRVRDPFADRER